MHIIVRRLAGLAAAAALTSAAAGEERWTIQIREGERVAFRGLRTAEPAGAGTYQMSYGPGAVGVALSAIGQAVVVNDAKAREMERLDREANLVLAPYEAILKTYTEAELFKRALEKLSFERDLIDTTGTATREGRPIRSEPVFFLTQDHRAIVLDNTILVGDLSEGGRRHVLRVVSAPRMEAKPEDFWREEDGARLKAESAALLAHALEIAHRAVATGVPDGAAQRTFRFREGSIQKMERAELVAEYCARKVIRTLRGVLLSIPQPPVLAPASPSCALAPGGL